jgi:MFS family permease
MGERFWQGVLKTTAGGSWTSQLPNGVQHNLRAFYFDGLFSSAQDAVVGTYLTLFILALGATNAQIGYLAAASSLAATIMLLPGAMLSERAKSRKKVVLITGGIISRLMLLVLVVVPFFLIGESAVIIAISAKVIADAMANLGYPAWTSLTADIVPLAWRGRYFGMRNIVIGIVGMLVTYLIGRLITNAGSPNGYQLAFGFAFIVGMCSTFSYSQIKEPVQTVHHLEPLSYSPASILQTFRADPNFLAFCVYSMLWNFAINIAGPFFNVYMVKELNATALMVGFISIASVLAGIPAQRFFGPLTDKLGARRVMLLTGFLIPLVPFVWIFTTQSWHPILINILSGVLWAGFNLAAFNFLLSISSTKELARYTAIAQIAVAISSAGGAALGGQIVTQWGYVAIFLCSAVGRFIASLLFARFVKEVQSVTHLIGNPE